MNRETQKTDRYVSFQGIDCEGNAAKVVDMLLRHIEDPEKTNVYWERFREKLARAGQVGVGDKLFLIHANINNIRELFEEYEDQEALRLLQQLEEECC